MLSRGRLAPLILAFTVARCHVVITYPGWRGNNLVTNGSIEEINGLGVGFSDSELAYPYGMQWIYSCGVSLQPSSFAGHEHALIYMNIGFGDIPANYSVPLWPRLEIVGPSNSPYPGTICLPEVPVPSSYDVKPGDNATIQVVEAAVHGAAMYSCVDVILVEDPKDVNPVNETTCFNSTSIRFVSDSASGTPSNSTSPGLTVTPTAVATVTSTNAASIARFRSMLGMGFLVALLGKS
ncbi:hypothetical protein BJ170DRAFT_700647 [Xylariales sp. AK1849]|nr:hypothetical protein BJ170DRAFT_700647 [Xylariales sp. AK1849]